jgi:D-sedoheptulose 7-phosphate isomerase
MEDRLTSVIAAHLAASRQLMDRLCADAKLARAIEAVARHGASVLGAGGKILLAGNGGSAAGAQHLAAELVGRLGHERPGLAAVALTADGAALTALANDYGFAHVFARQVEALGRAGDLLMVLSTSGQSPNVIAALHAARSRGLGTVGLTGTNGRSLAALCDHLIAIPSDDTQRIQEGHAVVGHIVCALIEQLVWPRPG